MNTIATNAANDVEQLEQLAALASEVIARCRQQGASQAEVGMQFEVGLNVNVRLGEVETVEHTRDRGIAVTVYVDHRKGSASTADLRPDSISTTIEQAIAIARHTEADPAAGLADPERMATVFPDLDLWHPWALDADQAIELGIACEAAGRDHDARISNSDGASVSSGSSLGVYANSHGFVGRERRTRHSLSCSLIAEDAQGMQRDYWFSTAVAREDLEAAEAIGRHAAQRTLARLDAAKLSTRTCPVLFAPELARGLIGHLVGAVSGGALYRKASFLLDKRGERLFPAWFQVHEDPFLRRGLGSGAFDADGVASAATDLIRDGVLARYVLGSYSARRLGLESTGNAGGIHNLKVAANAGELADLVRQMDRGLLVTELMGQGVNILTGDYSRGAAGFWVENGAIVHPVHEVTIAAHLGELFQRIVAVGKDTDTRSNILCGSILVEGMTVAGS
ncbi:MAG: metalloprotease PmbA [Lysobacterales bacterium]